MRLNPPPSVTQLVKDNLQADQQWKTWLNLLYEHLRDREPYPGLFTASGTTNITTSAATIGLDTEDFDPDEQYTLASNVITVATEGYYNISYMVPIVVDTVGGGGDTSAQAYIEIDSGGGFTPVAQSAAENGFNVSSTSIGASVVNSFGVQLSSGDDIRLRALASTAADLSATGGSQLSIRRLRK